MNNTASDKKKWDRLLAWFGRGRIRIVALIRRNNNTKNTTASERKKRGRLLTRFGRRIETMSYRTLGIWIAGVLIGSALLYWLLNMFGEGTNKVCLSFGNALYFSVITFTSTGYGDILPVGFGKLVSAVEVLSGIMFVAMFVGKIASERQSALLLLIYTGDQQRRLREFSKAIADFDYEIAYLLKDHRHDQLEAKGRYAGSLLASINSYLCFQSHQGRLADFGNVSALRSLYHAIIDIQYTVIGLLKIHETPENERKVYEALNKWTVSIAEVMIPFHVTEPSTVGLLKEILSKDAAYQRWILKAEAGAIYWEHNTSMTDNFLQQVIDALPPQPWPRDTHKMIARKLFVSFKFAKKCIDTLIERNTWPDYKK